MRPDQGVVAGLVPGGARVLDVGCGDGALLEHLRRGKGCEVTGVEIDPDSVLACIARGVPVIEADIDGGLQEFEDGSFDVVVLSQTLQATRRPLAVLREGVRVGRRAVVSFPNFGHWRLRAELALAGRMPSSPVLPYAWYETPNIHLCTIRDFDALLQGERLATLARIPLGVAGQPTHARAPNLLAAGAVYLVARR